MKLYYTYAFIVPLFCGLLLVPVGCNEGATTDPEAIALKEDRVVRSASGQVSPLETIKKEAAALRAKDREAYLDTVQYTEAQKEYALAMFGLNDAYELQQALVEKFGEDAWDELQKVDIWRELGGSFTYTVPPLGDKWHKYLKIKIRGDQATWVCKWGRIPEKRRLVFDKEQNAWLSLLPGMPKDEQSIKTMSELIRNLAKAARAGLKAVDEPDITIREIKLRMGEDFFGRPRKEVEPQPEPKLEPEPEPELEKEAEGP